MNTPTAGGTATHRDTNTERSLLETLRYTPGTGFRHLERHLARASAAANDLGYDFDAELVRDALSTFVSKSPGRSRVRLLVHTDASVNLQYFPLEETASAPTIVEVDSEPVDSSDPALRYKTTDREHYNRIRARFPLAEDVLMVNEKGAVTESTIANVAFRIEGCWWTPPLSAGCLPGVERAHLIDAGLVRERNIHVVELRTADQIILFSSLRGIRKAVIAERRI